MTEIYTQIQRYLKAGKRTVLARIIRQAGSAPRAVGTACLVTEDGKLFGTIGGGRLEFDVLTRARTVLKENQSDLMAYRMTGEEVAETEMLCGGSVDIYLEPLFPENKATVTVFSHLAKINHQGENGVFISRVLPGTDATNPSSRMFIGPEGDVTGDLGTLPQDLKERVTHYRKAGSCELIEAQGGGTALFIEPIRPQEVVYLFGAGHISRFVAKLSNMVGFSVVVIDDRHEFANANRFPQVTDIMVTDFNDAFDRIHLHRSTYVVIVTRGHVHDSIVLKQALAHKTAYIGMIGSRRKIKLIYQSMRDEGGAEVELERVQAPIGLSIGAQTPEEIAVSIVAELIKVRAERLQLIVRQNGIKP